MEEFNLDGKFKEHRHNGLDAKKIALNNLIIDKQDALTAKNAGAVSTTDATTDAVIENNRTRIEEIEQALQNLGLLE